MRTFKILMVMMMLGVTLSASAWSNSSTQEVKSTEQSVDNKDKLVIVWSTDDPGVAQNLIFMYSYNALRLKWFNEVTIIIWGPSARLVATDKSIQEQVAKLKESGVIIRACVACANNYGVTDKLRELGYDVKGMGVPLTDYIKQDYSIVTF